MRDFKVGDTFSLHSYGALIEKTDDGFLMENTNGDIGRFTLLELNAFTSADHYSSTTEVSRSKLIEIIRSNPKTAMTIGATKKLTLAFITKTARQVWKERKSDTLSGRSFLDMVARIGKQIIEGGETREFKCYHDNGITSHGYLLVKEITPGAAKTKSVVLTNTQWAIINNTRYLVKK